MTIAPHPDAGLTRKGLTFLVGVTCVGVGVSLAIRAGVGVAPYDVLTTGLASLTGITIGLAAIAVPLAFTAAGFLLGGRVGPGTAIATVTVGPIISVALWLVPEVDALAVRIPMFALGSLVLAIGITAVVIADLGPGPAELLMLAIHDKGFPLAPVRTAIELGCVGLGWAMGGQVGVGTVVFAFLIGPLLRRLLDVAGYRGVRAAAEPGGAGP